MREGAEARNDFTCSLCRGRKAELRMAAYSINPGDSGSVMNNSTITQRPKWHFTLVAWEKHNATVGASLPRGNNRCIEMLGISACRGETKWGTKSLLELLLFNP